MTTKKRISNLDTESDEDYQMQDEILENDDALSDEYQEKEEENNLLKGLKQLSGEGRQEKQASINMYSYEFESIMRGKKGDHLIKYLSDQPLNSPLFENPTVHAYLDSQWQQFKWNYYLIVFLYLLGFVIMFPYFELFTHAMNDQGMPFGYIVRKHYIFFIFFLPVQVAISVFLSYFEFVKMWRTKDKY